MPVYMIRAGEDGPVRIHWSGIGSERVLAEGQRWSLAALRIVREIDAGWTTAVRIRHHYADRQIQDEWFAWSDDMLTTDKDTWSPLSEQHQRILDRLIAGGVTMNQIAKEFDLSRERVRQIAAKRGHTADTLGTRRLANKGIGDAKKKVIEENKAARKLKNDEHLSQILALDDLGLKQKQIAERIGIQQSAVSTILISAGRRTRLSKRAPDGPVRTRARGSSLHFQRVANSEEAAT